MKIRYDKQKILNFTTDMLLIVLGSFIMALGYSLFIIPHHFVPGGVSGISIIVNYFTNFPVGILIIIFNIPIFLLGIKLMGKSYGIKSFIGMIISSLLIDFFYEVLKIKAATDNLLLSSVYAGVFLGAGLGIIFTAKASTGGTDTVGQVLNKYFGVSVGFGILMIDFIIISLSGIVFKSWDIPLYSYIVLFISTKVIDLILEGWNFTKLVIINSTKNKEIEKFIMDKLNRGGTALKSRSLYLKKEGEIIMSVVYRKQIAILKDYIKEIDPNAFVIISDTYAVLGRGFKSNINV